MKTRDSREVGNVSPTPRVREDEMRCPSSSTEVEKKGQSPHQDTLSCPIRVFCVLDDANYGEVYLLS